MDLEVEASGAVAVSYRPRIVGIVALWLVVGGGPLVPPAHAACDAAGGCSMVPVADTYIETGTEAAWDHGGSDHVDVDMLPRGITYLKFDLAAATTPVVRATLQLYCTNWSDDGGTIYRVASSSWVEGDRNGLDEGSINGSGLTWNDVDTNADGTIDAGDSSPYAPDFDLPLATLGPVDRKTFLEVEVTGAFQAGPGIYTLAIASGSSNGATYSSREHPSLEQRPVLFLELEPGPSSTSTTSTTTTSTATPTTTTSTTTTTTTTVFDSTTLTSTTTTIPDPPGGNEISGIVREQTTLTPIPGALIRLQATDTSTVSESDGSYALPVATGTGLVIVGAHKGYFNQSVVTNAPATGVEILLQPVPQDDDPDYTFVTPTTCGRCHPDQLDQWTDSPMALAGLNTWVHDIYSGTGTPGGMGGFVYTRDSVHAASNPSSECASCHQPELWIENLFSPLDDNLAPPQPGVVHGISCDVCHKIADIDESLQDFPGIWPGVVTFTRPQGPAFHQVQYGLLGDVDYSVPAEMRASYQPQLAAAACGACHQDRNDPDGDGDFAEPDGVISEPTYNEWLASPYGDPQSPRYTTCVDCHMAPSGKDRLCKLMFPPLLRDPNTIRSHTIEGTTPAYLDNAIDLSMEATVVGNTLEVDVDVINTLTGHHVPTGVTVRNMILLVEAWREEDGLVLTHTGTQTIHALGGVGDADQGYYAGLPGKLYAKVNHDTSGHGPTFFTDATGILFDSRIPALATDSTSYAFAVPSAGGTLHVRSRVIYRRAFRFLVDAKQWTTDGHGNPLEDVAAPHYGHLMETEEEILWQPPVCDDDACDGYGLMLSLSPDRALAAPLQGQAATGDVFVFVEPETGIAQVEFFLDGQSERIEGKPPYDLGGTARDGTARPIDTTALSDGAHVVTAVIERTTGEVVVADATLFVGNHDDAALAFTADALSFEFDAGGGTAARTVGLGTTNGEVASYASAASSTWTDIIPASGLTPDTLTVVVDTTGLPAGTYVDAITATAPGFADAVLTISATVGDPESCGLLSCTEVRVEAPYVLTFDEDHGGIHDAAGIGTGFTYVDPPTNGVGYIPGNLALDAAASMLDITTTAGLQYKSLDSLDNALGVGIDAAHQVTVMTTTLVDPPTGTGSFEQAGLWFGTDEDHYVKLVVLSTSVGTKVQFLLEVDGAILQEKKTGVLDLANTDTLLRLRMDPANREILAAYRIDGGPIELLTTFAAPDEFFSLDGASIDPAVGTRSFGGIFASHRKGPARLVYHFDDFIVDAELLPLPSGEIRFDRTSAPVPMPTSLAWGPDGRLYATELFGTIHAITFGPDTQPIDDTLITGLVDAVGPRVTLGIAIDPASTPDEVVLWVSHSSPSLSNGTPNSGTVSRLSGPGFSNVEDVITGLPRSRANHAVNSIHFGPDDRLYIAAGGNTGAGAPPLADTEFGDMEEQPLSAALLAADVLDPGFEGNCDNPDDLFGTPPCDVVPYATGMRNMYDFVFHTNGALYAPDNGLGVTGSFPPSPTPPCFGSSEPAPFDGNPPGHNPGQQPDILLRVEEGKYYGHPNPYREECVFKDGGFQGVQPLPSWEPPILNLGKSRSADGTIEYTHDGFCGALQGDLLIANFSVGDDITRVRLSEDGSTVVDASSLADNFVDPLPLALGEDGVIYVGEFGAGVVTALIPVNLGCWVRVNDLPEPMLDAGGAALDGRLYVAGGKTAGGPTSSLLIYDPTTDTWTSGPDLPGPAVENPAVVGLDGKLYIFGGSTGPFSGAVVNATAFDPTTGHWTVLAPLAIARGGATAQAVDGLIHVVGGMDATGASLDSVAVYDPATDSWHDVASMGTRRDNPGSAVLDGKLYVFGGRTRNADGTEENGTLDSVEMYDATMNVWIPRAPMPTGRRTMVVGTVGGRAQVIGGEKTPDGGTFPQNEEYDPATNTWRSVASMLTARHGAAGGTIDDVVYVAGGGPTGGFSLSSLTDAFAF